MQISRSHRFAWYAGRHHDNVGHPRDKRNAARVKYADGYTATETMNYRHAYHAGNEADCLKHALLLLLLRALARKARPFFVLDTHAGAGAYDLGSAEAAKTGEAARGILRLIDNAPEPLADYLGLVESLGLYPGSPALIRALLREDDRLACCELHPEEHAALKRRFAGDRQVQVHHRDGYEALRGLLPPAERRGLVLIDPPFEKTDEFATLARGIATAVKRFPGAIVAAWYPVKLRPLVREFQADLQARRIPDIVTAELLLRPPQDPARLNGSGLLVVNPPYRFEEKASAVVGALRDALAGPDGMEEIRRIAPERFADGATA